MGIPDHVVARPAPPSRLQRWFPIAAWLPRYDWGSSFAPDLIAAIRVAALLIPESMGYASSSRQVSSCHFDAGRHNQ
jgi:MFS superfamily sulfate permease-like transporter